MCDGGCCKGRGWIGRDGEMNGVETQGVRDTKTKENEINVAVQIINMWLVFSAHRTRLWKRPLLGFIVLWVFCWNVADLIRHSLKIKRLLTAHSLSQHFRVSPTLLPHPAQAFHSDHILTLVRALIPTFEWEQ